MTKGLLGGCALAALMMGAAGSAQAQISGDVIKIGVMNDMSGTYSDIAGPGSVEAAKMAAEEFGGAINGKRIEIVAADHQNKPDVGAATARKWFDAEGVDMIVDLPTSSVALAVQQIAKEKGKVDIVVGGATTGLTGKDCSPTGIHWAYDTYALAAGTGKAIVQNGGDTWFFLTADYAFGHALEKDTGDMVKAAGGKVVGTVRHPFPNADFSSFLLQAQGSGAKVIGLANAGQDTINSIKQAKEFGIVQGGQSLAGLLLFITDIHSLGLDTAQGLMLTTGFYWDLNDETRAWTKKYEARMNKKPTMVHAGVYSAVRHYLQAIKDAGTDDGAKVVTKMKATPVNDMFAKNGKIRDDGRMVHDMYLAEVKKPSESKGPWDYYKIRATIPGDQAYMPLAQSACPLVKK